MKLALINAGGANLGSVRYALERLGVEPTVTSDASLIASADRVILPGVGAAGPGMARLQELGLVETLQHLQVPLLGICLGMQLLFESSEEGDVACLGLLPGRVRRMKDAPGLRVPHMGWNRLKKHGDSPLLKGINDGAQVYFVHGFAASVDTNCVASSEHGAPFAAVVQRDRVAGAQFHPERSGASGAQLLANFIEQGL